MPVVQFALRFFYFKQKYSLSLRIHTWAHGNASVSESLSFTENVPYVEAHAQIIVCEGVETEVIADFLKNEGCNEIQGFLYYRPMCIGDFETVMHIQNAV